MSITLDFEIVNKIDIENYIRQFNNVKRFAYKRFCEGIEKPNNVEKLCFDMNNIELMDSVFIRGAIIEAKGLYAAQGEGVIFGSKKLFNDVKFKNVDNGKYRAHRNKSLFICGDKYTYGNRKFEFDLNNNRIIFKPNYKNRIEINFSPQSDNRKKMMEVVQLQADNKQIPISVRLSNDTVHITFDEIVLAKKSSKPVIENRILSIDSNPNYIGVVVKDYTNERIVHEEVIVLKELNKKGKHSTDKKHHEIFGVAKRIAEMARHYRCEVVAVEKLNIKSKDNKKGKNYNRIVNNSWYRNIFFSNLKKWCNIYTIKYLEIEAEYSSYIGCITNPTKPDMIAAALEIGRRANLFNRIYIKKQISPVDNTGAKVNVKFPEFNLSKLPTHWKEMVTNNEGLDSWISFCKHLKKSKCNYRFLFDDWVKTNCPSSFSLKSHKSDVCVCFE